MKTALFAGIALLAGAVPGAALAEPVLFISIDGLRPGDVIEAEQRGLTLPHLRRFIAEGSYASGVIGNLPTVTYPSHTTLMTGVAPARHGVVNNTTFDPMQINQSGWYWYATDITVPTLWDAAAMAGFSTANVHWPVSVDAKSVTWNLPQIWRTGHGDDAKLLKALATPGLVDDLEGHHGPYAAGIDESLDGDINRAAFAASLIAAKKPHFITVYLTALDHEQHMFGPGSKEAHAVLTRLDRAVGELVAAELKTYPDAVIAVASDHGFAATDTEINLFSPFIDAGLITLDADGKVKAWEAMPWPSSGSAAIVLARPDDKALEARVKALLDTLKANPEARIGAVADRAEIARMDGNPQASFYVNFGPGALAGGFKGAKAPLVSPSKYKGTHGYFPAAPEMRSTFMMMGKGVPKARNLGELDMRQIAPTLARLLKVKLSKTEARPVL
jgi:predicted AlkP superfamily pyrophosphatase or phosphodiesterase